MQAPAPRYPVNTRHRQMLQRRPTALLSSAQSGGGSARSRHNKLAKAGVYFRRSASRLRRPEISASNSHLPWHLDQGALGAGPLSESAFRDNLQARHSTKGLKRIQEVAGFGKTGRSRARPFTTSNTLARPLVQNDLSQNGIEPSLNSCSMVLLMDFSQKMQIISIYKQYVTYPIRLRPRHHIRKSAEKLLATPPEAPFPSVSDSFDRRLR